MSRIDFVIGLTKFSGPASYPRDIGILPGISLDLLILVALVNVKSYFVLSGKWHYVRTDSDIHCTPKFKSSESQLTEREKKERDEEQDLW